MTLTEMICAAAKDDNDQMTIQEWMTVLDSTETEAATTVRAALLSAMENGSLNRFVSYDFGIGQVFGFVNSYSGNACYVPNAMTAVLLAGTVQDVEDASAFEGYGFAVARFTTRFQTTYTGIMA